MKKIAEKGEMMNELRDFVVLKTDSVWLRKRGKDSVIWHQNLDIVAMFTPTELFVTRGKVRKRLFSVRLEKNVEYVGVWGSKGVFVLVDQESHEMKFLSIEGCGKEFFSFFVGEEVKDIVWITKRLNEKTGWMNKLKRKKKEEVLGEIFELPILEEVSEMIQTLSKEKKKPVNLSECFRRTKMKSNVLLRDKSSINVMIYLTTKSLGINFFGGSEVGKFDISKIFNPRNEKMEDIELLKIMATEDLGKLLLLYSVEKSSVIKQKILGIPQLGENKEQFHYVCRRLVVLKEFGKRIDDVVQNIRNAWLKFAKTELGKFIDSFEEILQGGETTGYDEEFEKKGEDKGDFESFFIKYLMFGEVKDELITFLSSKATENKISHLLEESENSKTTICFYIIHYLHVYIQHAVFNISEIRGALKWKEKFSKEVIGIDPKEFDAVVKNLASLQTQSNEILKKIGSYQFQLSYFLQMLRRAYCDEICGGDMDDRQDLSYPLLPHSEIILKSGCILGFLKNPMNPFSINVMYSSTMTIKRNINNICEMVSNKNFESIKELMTIELVQLNTKGVEISNYSFRSYNNGGIYGFQVQGCYLFVLRYSSDMKQFEYCLFQFQGMIQRFEFGGLRSVVLVLKIKGESVLSFFKFGTYKFSRYSGKRIDILCAQLLKSKMFVVVDELERKRKSPLDAVSSLSIGLTGLGSVYSSNNKISIVNFKLDEKIELG